MAAGGSETAGAGDRPVAVVPFTETVWLAAVAVEDVG